jgi:hypothetical protein
MKHYTDPRLAYRDMKFLNSLTGHFDFTVCATVDGFELRRIVETQPLDPGFIAFKDWFRQQVYGSPNAVVKT